VCAWSGRYWLRYSASPHHTLYVLEDSFSEHAKLMFQAIVGSESRLPAVYSSFHDNNLPSDLGTSIKLCLTDPSFPAFVGQVEKELKKIKQDCPWIIDLKGPLVLSDNISNKQTVPFSLYTLNCSEDLVYKRRYNHWVQSKRYMLWFSTKTCSCYSTKLI